MPQYPPTSRRKCRYLVEWVRWGVLCTGFTFDISPTGVFVRSTNIPEHGESVTVHLLVRAGKKMRLRGTVVRSFCVPSDLQRYLPGGFGIRLEEAPEEYFELLASLFQLRLANAS